MKRKLSYYTMFSESVNNRGDSILFCSRSGESFVVSSKLKAKLIEGDFDHVPEETLEKLINSKGVVDLNESEEEELYEIVKENKSYIKDVSELYVVIQPSANCQLGCYYCGQHHTKDYLSRDHADAIIERVKKRAMSGNFKSLFIGWFGGEPLMALPQIRELTPRLIEVAEAFGLDYSAAIVSNGLSLKPKIFEELTTKLRIRKIELTLDGPAEFHDGHRYTKEGGKSFDLIFNNLKLILNKENFKELNCSISIRCNVDKKNWQGVSPLIKMLTENKFQDKISYFYPIGIYSWGGNDAQNNSLTKEEFAKMEIDWFIELLEGGFSPQILPRRQKQVCMAVSATSEMYDAFGNVFNCTEVSYTDVYKGTPYVLGNLSKLEQISDMKPLNDWNDTVLTDKFPCHTCKMLPVCGGSCPKSWHEDLRACPSFKFNIKDRLALGYVLSKTDIRTLQ